MLAKQWKLVACACDAASCVSCRASESYAHQSVVDGARRKRAAVEAEDYDAAKELKRDIERMRLSTDGRPAPSRASPPLPGHGSRSPAARVDHHAEVCHLLPSMPSRRRHSICQGLAVQPGLGPMMNMSASQCSMLHDKGCVEADLALRIPARVQGDATQSGTDRSHRRSSVAGSQDSQHQATRNHVEADASPAGVHSTSP